MRDGAETSRVRYFVEPHEFVVLQGLERDVLSVLSTNKVRGHATWIPKMDATSTRFVQLWAATESQSTFLLEWLASELADLSVQELRARLEEEHRPR
jgi:hypothetical protein